MIDAFILGLSSGASCLTTCAPLILPVLLSEGGEKRKKNALLVTLFTSGRLAGYLVSGFILGSIGAFASSYMDPEVSRTFQRISYIAAGLIMTTAGLLYTFPEKKFCASWKNWSRPGTNAAALGLFSGFSLCPPLFAAAARVFGVQSSFGGMIYFLFFFFGTSIYFLPLFGLPLFRKHLDRIRLTAKTAVLLIGVYYLVFMGFLASF